MNKAFKERHDFVVAGLNAIPGISCRPGAGTFYAFADVEGAMHALGIKDDNAFAEYLLVQAGVAVVPGSGFGAPGHMRISFACSMQTLEDALRRIERVLTRGGGEARLIVAGGAAATHCTAAAASVAVTARFRGNVHRTCIDYMLTLIYHVNMKYKNLGNTGLKVSELCLGCMTFGVPERGDHPWTLPENQSRALIRQAVDLGINFFDTANTYSDGTSEEIVGRRSRISRAATRS